MRRLLLVLMAALICAVVATWYFYQTVRISAKAEQPRHLAPKVDDSGFDESAPATSRNLNPILLLLLLPCLLAAPWIYRFYNFYRLDKLIDRGDYAQAVAAADRIMTRSPAWAGSYTQKGSALIYAGRLTDALETLRVGLQKGVKDQAAVVLMHTFEGQCLVEMGRYEEARAAFARGHLENYDELTHSAEFGLAELEMRLGNPQGARERVEPVCGSKVEIYKTLEPDNYARAFALKAWIQARLGQHEEAGRTIQIVQAHQRAKSRPVAAATCFYLGLAEREMHHRGNQSFEKGAALDAQGLWGRYCHEAASGRFPEWANPASDSSRS